MGLFCLMAIVVSLAGRISAEPTDSDLVISLSTGQIRGKTMTVTGKNRTGHVFLGVPFGAPAVGNLRFEPPEPRSPWSGILDCTKFGPACMQKESFEASDSANISEDCLLVNVLVMPSLCNREHPCPVLTLYQGGAWYFDSENHFPLEELLDRWASRGLVVVAAAYRMGVLGFWNTGTDHARGNYALYDMLESLRWIQKDISNFGGDPRKVTILGYSSSACGISQLSLSPSAYGLFHGLIPMSGSAFQLPLQDFQEVNQQVAFKVGCAQPGSWNKKHFGQIVACMKSKPVGELMAVQKELEDQGQMYHGPRVDGHIFPGTVEELAAKRLPFAMMTGTTLYEVGIPALTKLLPNISISTIAESCRQLIEIAGLPHPRIISLLCAQRYTLGRDKTNGLRELVDDVGTFGPTYTDARSMLKSGAPVYLYSFDYVKKGLEGMTPFHAFDVFLVFRTHADVMGQFFDARDEQIADIDVELMSNFAKYFNPTPKTSSFSTWQTLQPHGYNYYKIDLPEPRNEPLYHYRAVNFWDNIVPMVEKNLGSNIFLLNKQSVARAAFRPKETKTNWKTAFWVTLGVGAGIFLALLGVAATICVRGAANRKSEFEKYLDMEEKRALLTSYANS